MLTHRFLHSSLTRPLAALALAACLAAPVVASAGGYKSRDAKGHWVLTNLQPAWTVAPGTAPPPPAASAAPQHSEVAQDQDTAPHGDETRAAPPDPAVQRAQTLLTKARTLYTKRK